MQTEHVRPGMMSGNIELAWRRTRSGKIDASIKLAHPMTQYPHSRAICRMVGRDRGISRKGRARG